ncbi:MAG: hypothetical protein WBG92_25350 [Thiohalocapsa sp.]
MNAPLTNFLHSADHSTLARANQAIQRLANARDQVAALRADIHGEPTNAQMPTSDQLSFTADLLRDGPKVIEDLCTEIQLHLTDLRQALLAAVPDIDTATTEARTSATERSHACHNILRDRPAPNAAGGIQ